MPNIKKEEYKDLLHRYKSRIEKELGGTIKTEVDVTKTKDYQNFRKELVPAHLTIYEKACNVAGRFLNLKPDAKKTPLLLESISSAHLSVTPTGVASLGILLPLVIILFGSLVSFLLLQSMVFVAVMFIIGVSLIKPLSNMPTYIANYRRLKASNQMVLCIFYVVTYMRHTSNLENAIQFASEHLGPPLALDLKKIVWDVETEKFDSVKESLDTYLNGWRKTNLEFVESFNLISGSLLEAENSRRLEALDKSLDVILEETYEKMLHYAHHLKSPITMLHMLGIILPILGLVILPLAVSFIDNFNWLYLLFIYNIILPGAVYGMGKTILTKRPTGYGDTNISDDNPEYQKYRNVIVKMGKSEMLIHPVSIAVFIGIVLFLIGIFPVVIHSVSPSFEFPNTPDSKFYLLEYQLDRNGNTVGPFGLGASLFSLLVTLAFGLSFGTYFKLRSRKLIKIREKTKGLEDEFSSALFQLGNRLGDNIPAEMAFGKVSKYMQETNSGRFFKMVSINIQKMGMSVQQAIFHPKYGAILSFPSKVIESSMKVLIQSIKKGPMVAAQSLTNIARYIKEIHRVNERLKDLMADIVSSMTAQIKFLTPAISGIVVGITAMISGILAKLSKQMVTLVEQGGDVTGAPMDIANIFGIGIPTFHFQIVVGIYVVQIIYILTVLANGIENGSDKLNEEYQLGTNLINSTILYCIIAGLVMLLFSFIAASIMGPTLGY